ncbi:aldehyde dehydrogenase family protein, partial [Nocardia cyriacigeorgica]|uniref:aldehyde dehydrogenase family protein n=1 Tax=Nocardia cyriacigeorgica TaxID=135487 RepID=UPI002456C2E3
MRPLSEISTVSRLSVRSEYADVGPLFWDRQLDIVTRHVDDAVAKGATVLVGGKSDTADGVFFQPTL